MNVQIAAMASAIFLAGLSPASATGNAENGKRLYNQCRSCHTPDKSSIGPKHCDLINRKIASVPGYQYSPAMQQSEIIWTPENIDQFLANPGQFIPRNFMPFAGIKKPEERSDIIAYLSTLTC
jgi:cytochrome c